MHEQKPTVILVDDEDVVQRELGRQLDYRGVEVSKSFATGSETMDYLRHITAKKEDLPTAILVDLILQDMKGMDLIDNLIRDYPTLPIIVLSGKDHANSIRAYNKGAYAVMYKPVDYNELVYTVKELAKRNKLATEIAQAMKEITAFDSVLVWELDWRDYPHYKVTGAVGIGANKEFIEQARLTMDTYPRLQRMEKGDYVYYEDIHKEEDYKHKLDAKKRGWTSLLSFPFFLYGTMVGWIDCYKKEKYLFRSPEDENHKKKYLQQFTRMAGENIQGQRLREQSRIIHETNQNLAGILQEELIYDSILQKALEITFADCGWIYQYDPAAEKITLAHTAGQGAEKADKERLLAYKGGGVTGKVTTTGKSLNVKDVHEKESDFYDPERHHIPTEGLEEKSILAVPMRRGERTLGVLTVKSKHPAFFTPDDLQFLSSLAAIAAVSMERQKLMRHLEEMSRMAQTTTQFDELAQYVVNAVKDLTDATVNLWMISEEAGEGDDYIRLKYSTDKEQMKIYHKVPTAPGSSFSGNALKAGRHVCVGDLENLPADQQHLFVNREAQKANGWHSLLIVPLIGKNREAIGVISLLHPGINKFSDDDGTLIQHFANQAALALQEQRHLTNLQELTRIGQDLTSTLSDTKNYLQEVVKLARRISKADLVVIYPYDTKRKLFYKNEANVYDGKMLYPKNRLSDKPRDKGQAAFVREMHSIRVEDIAADEPFRLFTGALDQHIPVAVGDAAYARAEILVKDSKFIDRESIQSFVGVSLVAKKQDGAPEEVAVIYFNYRIPKHFTVEELQLMDIFCNQVANVIQRNRLHNDLEKERQLIEGIHTAALEIQRERNERKRLRIIVDEAVKLLDAKGGKVYLISNGGQRDLKLVAKKNLPQMKIGSILHNEGGAGKGLALEVARMGEPKYVNDYGNYANHIPSLKDEFSAVVEVPLRLQGETIGVLGVFDDSEKRNFTDADVRVLEQLAAQATLGVYNARLYDELEGLYQAGLKIAENAGLVSIANRILKELSKVIDYHSASIQLVKAMDVPREVIAYKGENPASQDLSLVRPPAEDELVKPIIESLRPTILSDTHQHLQWDQSIASTQHIHSWAGVPLVFGGEVLGLLILDHTIPGYYTEADKPKLERFALQAAIGIRNALLDESHLSEVLAYSELLQTDKLQIEDIFEKLDASVKSVCGAAINVKYHCSDSGLIRQGQLPSDWVFERYNEGRDVSSFSISKMIKGFPSSIAIPIAVFQKSEGVISFVSQNGIQDKAASAIRILVALAEKGIGRLMQEKRQAKAVKEQFNPYTVGSIITSPDAFFGRESILEGIISSLANNHFMVYGERRIGKSSLLYQIKHHLEASVSDSYQFLPVYLDYEATKEEELWAHTIDYIEGIEGKVRTRRSEAYNYDDFILELEGLLREWSVSYPQKQLRLVLLMDEMDVFNEFSPNTMSKMRRWLQADDRVRVVMAGVKIEHFTNDVTSPWYNMLNEIPLEKMEETTARALITEPVRGSYQYEEAAIVKILQLSQHKPMRIQQLCSAAVTRMLARAKNSSIPDLTILADDVRHIDNKQKK